MLATTAVFTNLKTEIQKLNYSSRKHKALKFWTIGTASSLQANLVHAKITDILQITAENQVLPHLPSGQEYIVIPWTSLLF